MLFFRSAILLSRLAFRNAPSAVGLFSLRFSTVWGLGFFPQLGQQKCKLQNLRVFEYIFEIMHVSENYFRRGEPAEDSVWERKPGALPRMHSTKNYPFLSVP